jgi:hypothetical protein
VLLLLLFLLRSNSTQQCAWSWTTQHIERESRALDPRCSDSTNINSNTLSNFLSINQLGSCTFIEWPAAWYMHARLVLQLQSLGFIGCIGCIGCKQCRCHSSRTDSCSSICTCYNAQTCPNACENHRQATTPSGIALYHCLPVRTALSPSGMEPSC